MSSQTISVIGAGKMGLPLVAQFAKNGATVVAVDINSEAVALINAGGCPIDEPGVDILIKEGVGAGRISATTSAEEAVAKSDSVIIIVPAMLTEDVHADLAILEAVTRQVAAVLKPGTLVSYETTVPVGTTRNAFKPILDEAGVDYHLAFSPERVKSNHVLERLESTPKVIGATNSASRERAAEFYATYLGAPIINAGSLEAAEFVKLAGMLYRDVNIAFANELAGYAEKAGIDLPSLMGAINANAEANLLLPGIGVGGHCAPVYPYFVIRHARELGHSSTLAERAREINDGQAEHVVARLERSAGSLAGKQVLILGLGFRPAVKEHLFSPAFLLRDALEKRGAEIRLHDGLYSDDEICKYGFEPTSLEADPGPEAVILNTAHPEYEAVDFAGLKSRGLAWVVDGRNLWSAEAVRRLGLGYLGIGQPA